MKHKKHTKTLCQPLGLYSGLGRLRRGHGQRLGLPQQDGQQRRRRLSADLPAVRGHFQLCGAACGVRHGPPRRHRHAGAPTRTHGPPVAKRMGKVGGLLGWLPLAGSLCIAIGYAVIVTYVLKALVDSVLGTLMTTDTAAWFGSFSAHALFRHPLPHHRGGGHAADPITWAPTASSAPTRS